jgi:hypothetical protein
MTVNDREDWNQAIQLRSQLKQSLLYAAYAQFRIISLTAKASKETARK